MTINLDDVTLYCSHIQGRDELMDELSRGTLDRDQQVLLWSLSLHMIDHPEYFRVDQVLAFQIIPGPDDTYFELWRCPVCSYSHEDQREMEIVGRDDVLG